MVVWWTLANFLLCVGLRVRIFGRSSFFVLILLSGELLGMYPLTFPFALLCFWLLCQLGNIDGEIGGQVCVSGAVEKAKSRSNLVLRTWGLGDLRFWRKRWWGDDLRERDHIYAEPEILIAKGRASRTLDFAICGRFLHPEYPWIHFRMEEKGGLTIQFVNLFRSNFYPGRKRDTSRTPEQKNMRAYGSWEQAQTEQKGFVCP